MTIFERSLPREAYWDGAFFERERRAIFWNQWFLVGRAAHFAPDSFSTIDVAGESLVIVCDRSGTLHAHRNFCRHRGSRLTCGDGALRGTLRCPYHGWAYAPDGTLVAAPHVALEDVPVEARRLKPVEVAEWGGFLFVRVGAAADNAPGLLEQLSAVDRRTQRYPLCDLRVGRTLRYEVAANWKVVLENYNECYHCAGVHPELCRLVPAFKRAGGAGLDWENGIPHRAGAVTFTADGTSNREPFARLDEFEKIRHKGELIYPNLMLSLSCDHVAAFTLWPHGPAQTSIVCELLFHPDEIGRDTFSPDDAVDFWDLVNRQDWSVCENVQCGMRSLAFERGYYAPMEDSSLDIRRYLAERLGADA